MNTNMILRAIGALALVAAYAVYRFSNGDMNWMAFTLVVTAIVGVVAPEILDELPIGPSK
jgi:hypothetical protein